MSPIQIFEHYLAHGGGIAACIVLVGLAAALVVGIVFGVVAWAKREPVATEPVSAVSPVSAAVPAPRNE